MRNLTINARLMYLGLLGLALTVVGTLVPLLVYMQSGPGVLVAVILIASGCVVLGAFVWHSTKNLTKPIHHLTDAALEMAQGNFNINLRRTTGDNELSRLESALATLANNQAKFYTDLADTLAQHSQGNTTATLADGYDGVFKEVVDNVNQLMVGVGRLYDGYHSSQDNVAKAQALHKDIQLVVSQLNRGQAPKLLDLAHYGNDHEPLVEGVNQLATTIDRLMAEVDAVTQVANAYRGYGKDLAKGLGHLLDGQFTRPLELSDDEDFAPVATAITALATHMAQADTLAREQAKAQAHQQHILAQEAQKITMAGTQQQQMANTFETTLAQLKDQANTTGKDAEKVVALATQALAGTAASKREMDEMLTAMEGIRDSSESIANIILVVDGISRQTNLLALNASVEAARAGVHGRGFMVVAEEVRSLADKSKQAAEQTTQLVQESLARVAQGTGAATGAATAIEGAVGSVSGIQQIVSGIAQVIQLQQEEMGQMEREIAGMHMASRDVIGAAEVIGGDEPGEMPVVEAPVQKPRPVARPIPKPALKPVPKPVSKPVPQPVKKPVPVVSKPVVKPVLQPMQKPTPKPAPAPTPRPVSPPPVMTSAKEAPVPSGAHEYDKPDFGKY